MPTLWRCKCRVRLCQLLNDQQAIVVAVQANFYWVQFSNGQRLLCTRREKLKKMGTQVVVGDTVTVTNCEAERGVIVAVAERRSQLDRPPIANVDEVCLVFAMAEPVIEPVILSKFLVQAESVGVGVQLCLNKCDLVSESDQAAWRDRLTAWGYPPLMVSTITGAGMSLLQEYLQDRITVFAGHSGVGKSSLIGALIPDLELRIAAVSGKLSRGRHTTRHVELFELPTGGLIADTPGFNQPDLACDPIELAGYFPELRRQQVSCQFADCLHATEPGCGMDQNWERYEHYRSFLTITQQLQQMRSQQRQPERQWKQKDKTGETTQEPRLAAKQYRRPSRRQEHQKMTEFTVEVDEYGEPMD
jgi:ribosome biogenesis GTPase / thiamine phosphate phosphatase